jgi:hypothetical protein
MSIIAQIAQTAVPAVPMTPLVLPTVGQKRVRAYVNANDNRGRTSLHDAATKGHAGIVEALLRAGANVDPKDLRGYTPFMLAVKNGHAKALEHLLNHGCDANVLFPDVCSFTDDEVKAECIKTEEDVHSEAECSSSESESEDRDVTAKKFKYHPIVARQEEWKRARGLTRQENENKHEDKKDEDKHEDKKDEKRPIVRQCAVSDEEDKDDSDDYDDDDDEDDSDDYEDDSDDDSDEDDDDKLKRALVVRFGLEDYKN